MAWGCRGRSWAGRDARMLTLQRYGWVLTGYAMLNPGDKGSGVGVDFDYCGVELLLEVAHFNGEFLGFLKERGVVLKGGCSCGIQFLPFLRRGRAGIDASRGP